MFSDVCILPKVLRNKRNFRDKKEGSRGVCRQKAYIGARGGAKEQIICASVLLGSAETFIFQKKNV